MPGETDQLLWRGVRPVQGIRGVWPARNSVRVNKDAQMIGAGGLSLYVVPANKKLFISSSLLGSRLSADGEGDASLYVRDEAEDLLYRLNFHYYDKAGQQATSMSYMPALEAAAGDDVRAYNVGANIDSWSLFSGWLEDA